jgi:hypothetical protein
MARIGSIKWNDSERSESEHNKAHITLIKENRMIIILKNIPAKTKKLDVKIFITPAVDGGWLSKRGQIKNISFFAQKNIQTREIQHHGLVEIEPDSIAERVIKKLNRKIMVGKWIAISEYKTRNWDNDRRRKNTNVSELIKNKRVADRRGQYESIGEEIAVSSKRVFHMKGW